MTGEDNNSGLSIEEQGIDIIDESERKGTPRSLFWPWFASNISVLSMSYGAWGLGFGISFWQATVAAIIGVVASFLLVGVVSIAGKRGNAPTMVITRATFGVEGAKVPSALSWIATLGWEISLTATAVLALATMFDR
ncbi:MAG TPA: allantoin permease, partial [Bifidobacterium sp.]|nr:allantoin permease [Bifidobacterium sp.]